MAGFYITTQIDHRRNLHELAMTQIQRLLIFIFYREVAKMAGNWQWVIPMS